MAVGTGRREFLELPCSSGHRTSAREKASCVTSSASCLSPSAAAISVGTNPTFDDRQRTVEAYALDRDDLDLYGAHVAVDFAERLRETLKFGSVDELVAAMRDDVDQARHLLSAS